MNEEPDLETVLGLLHDDHVRTILRATSVEPLPAGDLADQCDASRQTIYRRLERLEDADLVTGHTQLREDGHHDTIYRATLDHLSIELKNGQFEFDLGRTQPDAADELTKLWRNF